MAILILNKSPKYVPYKKWLRQLDEDIIMITPQKQAILYKGEGFKEVMGFDNYTTNGCVELVAMELNDKYNYHTIISNAERDLVRAGKLRDTLKIKGQSLQSALAFRDKIVMKTYASQAGVRVPKFKKIMDSIDIINFIKKNDYPVVIKPIDGSGSENTIILNSNDDLKMFLSSGISSNLEIEEFIQGNMYHVDGLVLNNEIVFLYPSKLINGCLAFQTNLAVGSYILSENNPIFERLVEFTKKILSALPTPENTAFHMEVFHSLNDELVLCEIASRIGGAKIAECMNHAFGIDLKKIVVQAQCGILENVTSIKNSIRKIYTGFMLIPPQEGIIKNISINNLPDWVIDYEINAKQNEQYGNATKSTDSIAWFIIKGHEEQIVKKRLDELLERFQSFIEWETV